MQIHLASATILFALGATSARADELSSRHDDVGHITTIRRGVWEIDGAALGILSSDRQGDASVTRLSTDVTLSASRFVKDNLSIGVAALFDYDSTGDGNHTTAVGGAVLATIHVRLGLGAFFRPGLAVGAVFGTRESPLAEGTLATANELGLVTRLQLPLAYFTSSRLVLQAGPQINFTAGNTTPMGGTAQSFTRIAGGFAVGAGYAF